MKRGGSSDFPVFGKVQNDPGRDNRNDSHKMHLLLRPHIPISHVIEDGFMLVKNAGNSRDFE